VENDLDFMVRRATVEEVDDDDMNCSVGKIVFHPPFYNYHKITYSFPVVF